jgi:hypothetical protein
VKSETALTTGTRAKALHAVLHLLDRQVRRQADGHLLCKVDDLEIQLDDQGRPYVTAILAGPLALGPRLGGVPGRLMTGLARLLRPEQDPQPHRIGMIEVTEVTNVVTVTDTPQDLALERWTREHLIEPIPGADHED